MQTFDEFAGPGEKAGWAGILKADVPGGCMDAMTCWVLLLGFGVGVLSGVIGIGGGVLLVPGLILLLGVSQRKAQGTSLAALLLPVGILAFWQYYREGNADVKVGLLLAVGYAVGGFFGGWGAQYLPDLWLRRIFAVVLISLGTRMLWVK